MESQSNAAEPTEILLVDDRPENLLALEAVLGSPRYRLIKAHSGDEALRYLLNHEPALILMDVQMPDLDGYETATLIKSSQRTREIPIIFVTALSSDERYVHRAYDHGAVDYVYKPFDVHILRSKVSVFVDLSQKTQRLVQAEVLLREAEKKERERCIAQLELKSMRRERAEERKFRDLVEGIEHGIVWAMNADTLTTKFVSASAEELLGYPIARWMAEADFFSAHIYPDDLSDFFAAVERLRKDGTPVNFEHRFSRADGSLAWLHTGIRLSHAAEKNQNEIRGLSIDVSRLKETEASLERHRERSDFLADASGILTRSLDASTSIDQLTRLAVQKVANWCSIQLEDPADPAPRFSLAHSDSELEGLLRLHRICLPVPECLRAGESWWVEKVDVRFLETNFAQSERLLLASRIRPTSLISVPLRIRDRYIGSLSFVLCDPNHDYTDEDLAMAEELARRISAGIENTQLYQQTCAAVRIRDDFLSIASHELKTPLTPLKLQTQGLRRALLLNAPGEMDLSRVTRMLEASDRQINRLSRLIDDLLDISRITSGRLKLNFERFELTELLSEISERFAEEARMARCSLVFDLLPGIEVQWDRFRIEQVIVNLLTNAFKYAAGTEVRIVLKATDDSVELSVQDHGMGIAEADHSRVFGRFERAVSGNHFGGLGLGLYIVTQIVEAHGGQITLVSQPGAGSTFTVHLARFVSSPFAGDVPVRTLTDSGSSIGQPAS